MGIIDDYLNGKTNETTTAVSSSGTANLINQYLSEPVSETVKSVSSASPKPPISGLTKADSDEFNARPSVEGGENPRAQELISGIRNLPSNIYKSTVEDAKSGISAIGEGASDIMNNKPATGVGKVGLGALSTLVSPITGASKELIEKPVTEVTGNPTAGKMAELVATSGLPISKATKATIAAIPKNKALSTLIESIGPENAGAVAKAMRENPRLTPADLSPKVKQDVQSLFVNDGPHINYLADRVKNRAEGAKEAVEGAMDASLGSTVNAVDKVNELKQNIRNVGSQKIQPALENTGPVDVTPVVKAIDDVLKPGVNSIISNETQLASPEVNKQLELIRKYLTDDKSMRSDPNQLHQIQSALRSKAEAMLSSANGGDRQIGAALMKVRNGIVDAIDTAKMPAKEGEAVTAPSYKQALSNYRDEYHVQDAFEHGHDAIITNSKSIQNRPEFFKDWVKKASSEELEAAKEGARVAIDTQINGFKHAARRGTDVGEVEFNRQRIEALFGKEEADKLFTKLKHEREIADTNNKIVQGSQTAMRSASKEQFALPTKGDVGKNLLPAAIVEGANMLSSGIPGIGTAMYAGLKGSTVAKDAVAAKLQRSHNMQYSKYALPVEGPDRETLIQALEAVANKPPKQSLAVRASRLGSLVAP